MVMNRNIHNSIVVRVEHHYPTADWIEAVTDLKLYTAAVALGEVATVPGPWAGEVDWLFEKEEDAAWFVLKYNGRIVDPTELNGPMSFMVSFG